MNKQSHRQQYSGYQGRRGWGEEKRVKKVKYTVMEGDMTVGGEHTMQYTDDALQSCILATYMSLNNVTPVNLI